MFHVLVLLAFAAEPSLQLDDLLDEVDRRAPSIRVQERSVAAARAGERVAGAWEDPTFAVMVEDVPLQAMPMGEPAMQPMLTYRVAQPLNLFGRRRLAKEAAGARGNAERATLRRTASDARFQAASAFHDLWMNGEMAALLDRQIALLDRMREAAIARYAAGLMMGHHDVLRAEAELATMRAERASLADERAAMAAMLNALRGRGREEPVGHPVLPPRAPIPELAAMRRDAEDRPEIASARAMRAEMEARRRLARRMYLPMVMAEAFYQQRTRGGPDSFGGAIALTVPLFWFDRQAPEVEMADRMVARAQADVDAMQVMTDADLRVAHARALAADRTLVALEDAALPKLRETVDSDLAAYTSGQGQFLTLLEATMSLRSLEAERLRLVVRRELARLELARLLGVPLEPRRAP